MLGVRNGRVDGREDEVSGNGRREGEGTRR